MVQSEPCFLCMNKLVFFMRYFQHRYPLKSIQGAEDIFNIIKCHKRPQFEDLSGNPIEFKKGNFWQYTHTSPSRGEKRKIRSKPGWLLLGAWLCARTRVLGGGGRGFRTWAPRPPWTVSDIPEGEGPGQGGWGRLWRRAGCADTARRVRTHGCGEEEGWPLTCPQVCLGCSHFIQDIVYLGRATNLQQWLWVALLRG